MPHSKDPNRYDPGFANVLSYMEEGLPIITIECKAPTKALSFKMRLYGYAEAWKAEALANAKANPDHSKMCFERARIMARYRLTNIGTQVICESRDRDDFEMPTITTSGNAPERVSAEEVQAAIAGVAAVVSKPLVPKENLSPANKQFLDLLESVDKRGHKPEMWPVGPVDSDRAAIEGDDDGNPR